MARGPLRIEYVLGSWDTSDLDAVRAVLGPLLEALIEINCAFLRRFPGTPWLSQAGVRYQREPTGREWWQDIPTCLKLRVADCEDLACWRIAEIRVREGDPTARPNVTVKRSLRTGGLLFHIKVSSERHGVEDPSRALGMR